jgi:hypothetical protein
MRVRQRFTDLEISATACQIEERNPRERMECRWRKSAGALPSLAREGPAFDPCSLGLNMAFRVEKVNEKARKCNSRNNVKEFCCV